MPLEFIFLSITIVGFLTLLALAYRNALPFPDEVPFVSNTEAEDQYVVPRDRLLYEAQKRKERLLTEAMRDMGYERREIDLKHTEVEQIAKEKEFELRELGIGLTRQEIEVRISAKDAEYQQREKALELGKQELSISELSQMLREREFLVDLKGKENELVSRVNEIDAKGNQLDKKLGLIDLGINQLRQVAVDNKQESLALQLGLKETALQNQSERNDLQGISLEQTAKEIQLDKKLGLIDLGINQLRQVAVDNKQESLAQQFGLEKKAMQNQSDKNDLQEISLEQIAKEVKLDKKLGLIDLGINQLRQIAVDNKQENLVQQLGLERKELGIKASENRLQQITNDQDAKDKRLSLDAYKNRLDEQKGFQELAKTEIGLQLKDLKQQARDNNLSAREIGLRQQFKENQLRLERQWINLESSKLTFQEKQAAFRLDMKYQRDELSIRRLKLDLLSTSINEDYRIKSEWLKIQAGSNRNEYREQQHKLDRAKLKIDSGLESLRLSAWANNLQLKEGDIRQQRFLLDQIRKNWLL